MSIISAYMVPHPPITIKEISQERVNEVSETVDSYIKVAKQIAEDSPDTIIIISSHATIFGDYFHISPGDSAVGSFDSYGAPDVMFHVKYDKVLAKKISKVSLDSHIHSGSIGHAEHQLDHGTMIPLYFINQFYSNYKIIRISITNFTPYVHYQFGRCIQQACESLHKKITVIASGDLSHYLTEKGPYGYRHEGPIFDSTFTNIMKETNFIDCFTFTPSFIDKAGVCGLKPFSVLAGCFDGQNVKSDFYSYQGNLGVGYALCSYHPENSASEPIPSRQFEKIYRKKLLSELRDRSLDEHPYVLLARMALEYLVIKKSFLTIKDISEYIDSYLLNESSGVFVCIKKENTVRGCVGTVAPSTNCIAHEIITNSINAGFNDPRFPPISIDELPYLTYTVDIINSPEPICSIHELNINKYGVIVTTKEKRGLLLPNLSSITSEEQQVKIALKKAGIMEYENFQMQRFEVVRYSSQS